MTSPQEQNLNKTSGMFYLGKNAALGSQYIYDQTYKNYKIKQRFEKDPKFSYFNAVMQMKRKLSTKEQVYKKVFQMKDNQELANNEVQERKTFYHSKVDNSFLEPQTQVMKVSRLKRNSFKIMKEQSSIEPVFDHNQSKSEHTSMNRTFGGAFRTGHKSHMSLYDKSQQSHISLQMITKARNNRSYVELEAKQKPIEMNSTKSFYQPSNPKPRLDEIMHEYRRMNRHSHQPKTKKSTLPKEFLQKLYQTNKMFYSTTAKKRTSLY